MSASTTKCDVLIVGGGPAGIAAALALRLQGANCTVVDCRTPPIDKACGEGLMPDALEALAKLGVDLCPEQGAAFRGIQFSNESHAVSAYFPEGIGVGVRRTHLHAHLVERAESAGVHLVWGQRVTGLESQSARIGNTPIAFRWLVGADGQNSKVREQFGLNRGRAAKVRYGFRRHYRLPLWNDCVEVHWGKRGQIYITPVGPEEICVASISAVHNLRLDDALLDFPRLREQLSKAEPSSREQGALSVSRKLSEVTRGSVSMIGDASGSVDAVTGEGIATSFRQALALAHAIARNDLSLYERAHRQIGQLPHRMGRLMLAMDQRRWLQRRALKTFSKEPQIFARMLSVHVAHEPFARFLWQQGFHIAWRMCAPQHS